VLWVAGCPFVQRLSTGPGPIRKLTERFLPFRLPATVSNSRAQFRELALGAGSLWVLGDALDRRMWRVDARSGRVEDTIELGFPPTSAAVADGKVWITDGMDDRVVPYDVVAGRLRAPVAVGAGASGIAAGAGAVWVVSTLAGTVARIDPAAARVTRTIRVGGYPRAIAADAHAVWVTEHAP
jgi:YVTN family beta-propeller protein